MYVNSIIGLIKSNSVLNYNIGEDFNPPQAYPELSRFRFKLNSKNKIYEMVRNLFIKLKMDEKNLGTEKWNPFSEFIKKNDQILVKPNLVKHFHPLGFKGVISQITHGSILRPIIDYTLLALNGSGRIIIADTPLDKTDFERVIELNRIKDLINSYNNHLGINIELYDLRSYTLKQSFSGNYLLKKNPLKGPPGGYIIIDLKNNSEFNELDFQEQNYYTLADLTLERYNPRSRKKGLTNKYHSNKKHQYKIPEIILKSDVIISVPKLKTHKLAGITLNLKNMIGISEKIYLPHYRPGTPPYGDAFHLEPTLKKIMKRKLIKKIGSITRQLRELVKENKILKNLVKPYYNSILKKVEITDNWWGAWYGNDTLWRTIIDLNKIVLYADKEGKLRDTEQRKYFCVVDGIIAQEGEGPMSGIPRNTGVIIGGYDPVAVDTFISHIIGYDIEKLKVLYMNENLKKFKLGNFKLANIKIYSNIDSPLDLNLKFKLPKGYQTLSR